MKFPIYRQLDSQDCGPSCLQMVAAFYGRKFSRERLRELSAPGRTGVSMQTIADAAERIGFRTMGVRVPFERLQDEVPMPCIAHWDQNHFVVIFKITKKRVYVADPEKGSMVYSIEEFIRGWTAARRNGSGEGLLLLLEATPDFYEKPADPSAETEEKRKGLSFFFSYLSPHRKLIIQLIIGMMVALVLELMFPFVTQAIVDYGIGNQDMHLIYVLLAAQLMLSISQTAAGIIRSWIFLHMGARISISLIADFLNKLLRLPLSFFETRSVGDVMQRIEDHERVRRFLTSTSLSVIFSVLSFVVFAGILALYHLTILGVFVGFTVLSVIWIVIFMKRRRMLDCKQFELDSQEQDRLVQLVSGAQEIKVQSLERQKRWEWEGVAARLFRLEVKGLALEHTQRVGTFFFGKMRNILITFLAAKAVVNGEMSLGMMLSTQFIVGQLSSPVRELIHFLHNAQDAKLSLERMQQIYDVEDDEDYTRPKLKEFPSGRSLTVQNLNFRYPGSNQDVLQDIELVIPQGKVTAIVGPSGSGKTTFMKLLLGLYQPRSGAIILDSTPLSSFDGQAWRARCGSVMQDGFIFSDSIEKNIIGATGAVNHARLDAALYVSNLSDFVASLPDGLATKVGDEGRSLSGGQSQRLLIARAAYKNPEFIFFDEATSALDANNEHSILWNVARIAEGRTVVVIAHRLSTVQGADQIVVMNEGKIEELGTHPDLIVKQGMYYELVKNQLQLENLATVHAS